MGSLVGTKGNKKQVKKSLDAQGYLRDASLAGPGGTSAGFTIGPNGQIASTYNLGDYEPARQALLNNMFSNLGGQGSGIPGYVWNAANDAFGRLGPINADPSLGGAGNMQYDRDLESTLRGGAMSQMGILGQDPVALGQDRYTRLQEQAQPFEQRAFNTLQNNLFSTGRIGTTGGGLQTEAFARGLGMADQQRQLDAMNYGSQLRQDALSQVSQLLGQRNTVRSMEEQLNQGQFGRAQGIFGNILGLGTTNAQLGNQGFDIANALYGTSNAADTGRYNMALQSLGAASGLQGLGLNNFSSALNTAIARSNAGVGGASALAGAQTGSNGLGGVLGAGMNAAATYFGGASDERLKENLQEIGEYGPLKVYTWDWTQSAKEKGFGSHPTAGFIAQEVLKVLPEAVTQAEDGYYRVNVTKVLKELH